MKQIFGGEIINSHLVEKEYTYVRVTMCVDNKPTKFGEMKVGNYKNINFSVFKNNVGFEEFKVAFPGIHIQMMGEIWSKGDFVNVKLDDVCVAPDDYYEKPVIEPEKKPVAKKMKAR